MNGARIEVAAEPGTRVTATLVLHAPLAGEFCWHHEALAQSSGRVRLRVPYPTRSEAPPGR